MVQILETTLRVKEEVKLLTDEFIGGYPDFPEHMNPLGNFVYYRTYSRWLPEKVRRETWKETCRRATEYNNTLDVRYKTASKSQLSKMRKEAEGLFDSMFNLRQFLSGRTLWVGGADGGVADKFPLANFNCSFTSIRSFQDLGDIFYLLLVGTGAGIKVTKRMAQNIPTVNTDIKVINEEYTPLIPTLRKETTELEIDGENARMVVGDSKEGWVQSLKYFLKLISEDATKGTVKTLSINYNSIRGQGERLKTFGGTASGYEPLKEMFEGFVDVLRNKIDSSLAPIEKDKDGYGKLRPIHFLDFSNFVGNNVVVGGVRRCLPKGSLVHMKNGLTPIEDVKIGEKVLTAKGYEKVTDWVYQGKQELVSINTQMGSFKCTDKHKIAVLNDIGSYEWKQAKELESGDRIIFVSAELEGVQTNLPHSDFINAPELDDDMAWLIGYIHGNGYLSKKEVSVSIPINNKDIIEKVEVNLHRFGFNFTTKQGSGEYVVIRLSSERKHLTEYMEHIKKPNQSIEIPDYILKGLPNIRKSYLTGLYDSDGASKNRPIIAANSIYPKFLKGVQAIYSSIGIPTRLKKRREAKGNWKATYEISVVGEKARKQWKKAIGNTSLKFEEVSLTSKSQNDFGYPSEWIKNVDYQDKWSRSQKQMTVAKYEELTDTEQKLVPVEVKSVVYTGVMEETYDISVDSIHEFVCEGMLVHNTAEIFLFDADDYESMFAKYGINGIWGDEGFAHLDKVINSLKEQGIPVPSFFEDLKVKYYDVYDDGEKHTFTDPSEAQTFAESLGQDYFPFPSNETRPLHHRRMSNNSVAFTTKPNRSLLNLIFTMMQAEGEPGFINLREAAIRRLKGKGHSNPTEEQTEQEMEDIGLNPCAEILLNYYGVCNLTTVNVLAFIKKDGTLDLEGIKNAQRLSVRAGMRMTLVTLELEHWDKVQKADRLLGASLTGWKDLIGQLDFNTEQEDELKYILGKVAREEADIYADELGVNRSVLVTTVKPEGTLSQVAGGVSSGLHYAHSEYYIRRVRINAEDPLAKAAKEHKGWVIHADVGTEGHSRMEELAKEDVISRARTLVIDFPVHSGAKVTKDDVSIKDQFDNYFSFQKNYTEHNSSNTLTVKPHEWGEAEEIVFENWDTFTAVSFLAHDGGSYTLAPYEAITKEEYHKLHDNMEGFSMDLLDKHDIAGDDDASLDGMEECEGDICPIR